MSQVISLPTIDDKPTPSGTKSTLAPSDSTLGDFSQALQDEGLKLGSADSAGKSQKPVASSPSIEAFSVAADPTVPSMVGQKIDMAKDLSQKDLQTIANTLSIQRLRQPSLLDQPINTKTKDERTIPKVQSLEGDSQGLPSHSVGLSLQEQIGFLRVGCFSSGQNLPTQGANATKQNESTGPTGLNVESNVVGPIGPISNLTKDVSSSKLHPAELGFRDLVGDKGGTESIVIQEDITIPDDPTKGGLPVKGFRLTESVEGWDPAESRLQSKTTVTPELSEIPQAGSRKIQIQPVDSPRSAAPLVSSSSHSTNRIALHPDGTDLMNGAAIPSDRSVSMSRIVMNSPALMSTPFRTQSPTGLSLNEESRVLADAQPDLLQHSASKKEEIAQRGEVTETGDLITKAAERRGEILQQETNSNQGPHDPLSRRDSLSFSDATLAKQNVRLQAQEPAESLPTAIKPGMSVNGGSHGIPEVESRRGGENVERVPASRLERTQNLPVEELGVFVNGDGNHGQTNSIHSGTVGSNTYGASALDLFDRTNLISQLVEKIQVLSRERDSEIVVSLKPEFLGRISLKASMENDSLVTTLVAESTHARSLLESQLPALQQVLQDHGLPSAKVVVLHGNDISFSGSGFGQPQPQQQSRSRTWNPSHQLDTTVNEINESKEASVPLFPSLMGFQPRALNVVV